MEAAFVDFGSSKNGVLYAGDLQSEGRSNVRIEEALSAGDEIVVQVVKDAMGAKGARRLPEEVRDRLRNMLKELRPAGFGVIVRTAAISASKEDIRSDIQRLIDRWDAIQKQKSEEGEVPRILYEEPALLIRVIRAAGRRIRVILGRLGIHQLGKLMGGRSQRIDGCLDGVQAQV